MADLEIAMHDRIITPAEIIMFVTDLLNPAMHMKRARSIGQAVVGVVAADRLSIAAVGRALARQLRITPKSGIKQIDRLLGNVKFDVKRAFRETVPWLVAGRKKIVVSMDWTEYASDGHSRIALNLVTRHGRATPLVWQTVETCNLKRRRNRYEDEALELLRSTLPEGVKVTILADRGFGDVKLYKLLRDDFQWDFVIRFRAGIRVKTAAGESSAGELVPRGGHTREIADARVTNKRYPVAVVCVKQRKMKESWCLATTIVGDKAQVVKLYGRRFTCEENFRDEKDRRYGYGFLEATVSTPERRDRFLFIAMLAIAILTLLGAAGESIGCDRQLRANTVKRRTHSLLRQGREYLAGCAAWAQDLLRRRFFEFLHGHAQETLTFANI